LCCCGLSLRGWCFSPRRHARGVGWGGAGEVSEKDGDNIASVGWHHAAWGVGLGPAAEHMGEFRLFLLLP